MKTDGEISRLKAEALLAKQIGNALKLAANLDEVSGGQFQYLKMVKLSLGLALGSLTTKTV